jgi:type II secretory pathway component PulK
MKFSIRKNSSGVALIIVMIAIFVLAIMVAGFAYSMKVETQLAKNADNEHELLWLGRSGVEFARWVLAQEAAVAEEPYDSLNQIWAGGPGGGGETNSVLSGISLDNYQIGDGTVTIKIIDLERKANINTASTAILQQAMTVMGVDADTLSTVSDSIQDWIDTDDSPRIAGAESDYYQGLPTPYIAKNAPIDDMSELLLVKGIADHPEIYWGGSATNHPGASFQQHQQKLGFGNAPGQAPDYPFGLVDVFTPFSRGQININTADTNVLQLITGVDANTAATIIQQRAGPDGVDGTADDTPFRNPSSALTAAGISAAVAAQISRVCTTRSYTFEVHVTAKIGDYTRDYTALLFRNGGDVEVLSFYWK